MYLIESTLARLDAFVDEVGAVLVVVRLRLRVELAHQVFELNIVHAVFLVLREGA